MKVFRRIMLGADKVTESQKIYYTASSKIVPNKENFTFGLRSNTWDANTKEGVITSLRDITTIDYKAFSDCTDLISIKIPEKCSSINGSAFYNCTGLTEVFIPDSVEYVSGFNGCTSLTSVQIGNGIKEIGNSAFNGCTSLSELRFSSNVNVIGSNCFRGIQGNVIFDETCQLKTVDIHDWKYDSDLKVIFNKDVEFTKDIVSDTGVLNNIDIKGTLYFNNSTIPSYANIDMSQYGSFEHSNINKVVLSKSVTKIGAYSFSDGNINELHIEKSLYDWMHVSRNPIYKDFLIRNAKTTYIDGQELVNIVIPPGITTIGDGVFMDIATLKSVITTDNITEVGISPFYHCTNLQYIDLSNQTSVPAVDVYKSWGIIKALHVVPNALYDEWISSEYWYDIKNYIVGVDTALHFKVGDMPRIVESGYTWEQYIASNFYQGGYTIVDGVIMDGTNNIQLNGINVLATDVIVADSEYTILVNE